MSALAEVAAAGGRVWIEGKKLRYRLPKDRLDLLEILKAGKAEILAELSARDKALLELCRTACKGLALWPQELVAALDDDDKAAQLDGSEGPEVLRTFAASLAARLRTGTLPKGLDEAYTRLRADLSANPGRRFASEVLDPDADPVLMAVAVRGAGFAALRIARDKYDAGKLIEIVHRFNTPEVSK